jgi:hypothetical protein
MKRSQLLVLAGVLFVARAVWAGAPTPDPVRYQFGARIPMRDGVELQANLYRPESSARKPVPAVFVKTPYGADGYHRWAVYFAEHGYAVAVVDARGRGNSGGVFRAAEDDGKDGHDVVEWLARQAWCNGKVGMFGGSYDGFGQWATLKELPPHLATIVPTASVRFGLDFPMLRNVGYPYVMRWLTYVSAMTTNFGVMYDDAFWRKLYEKTWREGDFDQLDELAGNPHETFRKWIAHPSFDDYWRGLAPSAREYAKTDIPILTITGQYDDDQLGAMSYYREHVAAASKAGRAKHYLVMGPWDHGGTRRPAPTVGGLNVGDAAVIDMLALHVAWFDWTLKGGKQPDFLKKRVTYYVTRALEWRWSDDLAGALDGATTWYLGSDGRADDVFASGVLADKPGTGSDPYRSDPGDERFAALDSDVGSETPVAARLDAMPPPGASLVYHTAPFDADVELGGFPSVTLFLKMDVPDTDLMVRLYEVRTDGSTVVLSTDVVRARHRAGLDRTELVPAGKIVRIDFEGMTAFYRRIEKGSRLRLVVGPPAGVSWQKNFQSGKPVAEETAGDARVGTIELVHDAEHPSRLVVGRLKAPGKKKSK